MERVESHQEVWKQYSGRVAWASFALAFVCILAFPALAYLGFTGSIPLWAAVMGNTLLAYLAFTPLHEASHSNIGTRKGPFRWLDSLVGWLMAGILFAPYSAFKVLHLRHHSNTNDPDSDPDRWMSTSNPLGLLLRGLTIMPRYYFHYFRHMDKQGRDNLPATLTGVLLLAAIATGLSYIASFWAVAVLWILPSVLALALLAIVFDWLPHYPHNSRDRYQNTRVIPGQVLNWMLLGQNYHLVHHLYPAVPFYSYKPVFDRMRGFLEEKGSPIGMRGDSWSAGADTLGNRDIAPGPERNVATFTTRG